MANLVIDKNSYINNSKYEVGNNMKAFSVAVPDKNEIINLLRQRDPESLNSLMEEAYKVKLKYVGNKVYLRGLIEISNICIKDCLYCGIRRGNQKVRRYDLNREEILESARWALENNYGSVVLQSGERTHASFIDFITRLIQDIKGISQDKLGITLSLGEQTQETYQKWFLAGAHRYLLRIETSNPHLYKKLHPADHLFENRLRCLQYLKETGYQVGTGVMIGLPGQTEEDLAGDILFFKEHDIDMIGMGPYIVHKDTPLAEDTPNSKEDQERRMDLALRMIALTRLILKDVNIASTTALQTLNPVGRELGLLAGANIVMPNITPLSHRKDYLLYDDKPCTDDDASHCRNCLENRVKHIGETIAYGQWGDSPHFINKGKK